MHNASVHLETARVRSRHFEGMKYVALWFEKLLQGALNLI
jgi:hypothetical protein